jgi:hypothetical protein
MWTGVRLLENTIPPLPLRGDSISQCFLGKTKGENVKERGRKGKKKDGK